MALTTETGLKAAIAYAQKLDFFKASATAEGAGTWHSMWKASGRPLAGSNPPAYTANSEFRPTSATAGAFSLVDAGTSKQLQLAAAQAVKSSTGIIRLYDRLWACSGFVTNSTGTQTVTYGSSYPVNRGPSNGVAVEPWLEVYTAPGATGATWTVNYQDQALGGVNAATYTHPANAETAGQMMPLIMAAGSASVYYPIDFTCSLSSGTAGDIGITLLRPICDIPITEANREVVFGYLETALAKIENSAALALMILCTATSTGTMKGQFKLVEG